MKDLFNFDNSDEIKKGLDKQLASDSEFEKIINKGKMYIYREEYEKAEKLFLEMIENNFENLGAHIGYLMALTKDYTDFSNPAIDKEISLIKKLFPDKKIPEIEKCLLKKENGSKRIEMEKDANEYLKNKKEKYQNSLTALEKELQLYKNRQNQVQYNINQAIKEPDEIIRKEEESERRFNDRIPYINSICDKIVSSIEVIELTKSEKKDFDLYLEKQYPQALIADAYMNIIWNQVDQGNYFNLLERLNEIDHSLHGINEFLLGYLYFYGLGVKMSMTNALEHFEKAHKLGNYDACGFIGIIKAFGYIDIPNIDEGYKWFLEFAKGSYNPYLAYNIFIRLLQNEAYHEYLCWFSKKCYSITDNYHSKYNTYDGGADYIKIIESYRIILEKSLEDDRDAYIVLFKLLKNNKDEEIQKMALTGLAELGLKNPLYNGDLGQIIKNALSLGSSRLAYAICKHYQKSASKYSLDLDDLFKMAIQNKYPDALYDLGVSKLQSDREFAKKCFYEAFIKGHYNSYVELVRMGVFE